MGCPAFGEITILPVLGRHRPKTTGDKMKRSGNLFDKTFSYDNMYSAYISARRGKRKKRACFDFEVNVESNIKKIICEIYNKTYSPEKYFKFMVYEPKPRIIYAPAFKDVIIQHAIYNIIYPIFDKAFISTSFACRIGYGTHAASRYLQNSLRESNPNDYTLKLDIKKFFYSIDREILRRLIEKKIKDKKIVDIMMLFAKNDESIGIPIGNLLSQIYALIYLNPIDHFIKRILCVKKYVRYVDDMVLIGLTFDQCFEYRKIITDFICKNLNLSLSKSSIHKVSKGVNFVGYRTWRTKKFIRKYSLYKFFRKAKKENLQSIVSILGHAKQSDSLPYLLHWLKANNPKMLNDLPLNYRRISLCR